MSARWDRVVVTGCAGFIGTYVADKMLDTGAQVHGIDNLNDYYDPQLKRARLQRLHARPDFTFEQLDIADHAGVRAAIARVRPGGIIHLAAQAGVRHSLDQPRAYIASNLDGFLAVLEAARHLHIKKLIYASSSSVYGANAKLPFSEDDPADAPVSLYAATKRATELMAYSYAHLFGIQTLGLRLFTVYGPWGRPDMAYFKFTKAILEGRTIDLYGEGRLRRDFTYIDDVAEAIARLADRLGSAPESLVGGDGDAVPHRIYNIGSQAPIALADFVGLLEKAVGRAAIKHHSPMPPGDVPATYADVSRLTRAIGFSPQTPLEAGLAKFVAWYRSYYRA